MTDFPLTATEATAAGLNSGIVGLFSMRLADVRYAPSLAGGIYALTCLPTGQVYVGSASCFRNRWKEHIHAFRKRTHAARMLEVYDRHGIAGFVCTVLCFCAQDRLKILEQFYIDNLKSQLTGLNTLPTAFSARGYRHTPEVVAQFSARMKGNQLMLGRKHTPESRRRMREVQRGHSVTERTIEKIRAKAKGRPCSESAKEKFRHLYRGRPMPTGCYERNPLVHKGHIKTEAHRQHIAAALRGKKLSAEHRLKIAAAGVGRKFSAESCEKKSRSLKAYYENKRRLLALPA